jgi:hypothetical protein
MTLVHNVTDMYLLYASDKAQKCERPPITAAGHCVQATPPRKYNVILRFNLG